VGIAGAVDPMTGGPCPRDMSYSVGVDQLCISDDWSFTSCFPHGEQREGIAEGWVSRGDGWRWSGSPADVWGHI
jgi:hypothetical protein